MTIKKIQVDKWVTSDGKDFAFEEAAIAHDVKLQMKIKTERQTISMELIHDKKDIFKRLIIPSFITDPMEVCREFTKKMKKSTCLFNHSENSIEIHGCNYYPYHNVVGGDLIFECEITGEIILVHGLYSMDASYLFTEIDGGCDTYLFSRDTYEKRWLGEFDYLYILK